MRIPPGPRAGWRDTVLVGTPFGWLGMVAAISLLEAPLKFRAEGVSRAEALAVGQLVFPALNTAEVGCAVLLLALLWRRRHDGASRRTWRLLALASGVLLVQVAAVRPVLHAATERTIAGTATGGSPWHIVYIVLEGAKLVVLLALAVSMVGTVVAGSRTRPARHEPATGAAATPTGSAG